MVVPARLAEILAIRIAFAVGLLPVFGNPLMIKQFLRGVLKRFGIVAFKRSSRVYIPEDESYDIVARLIGRTDPIVIDGGAHMGDAVEHLAVLLPGAVFHCFEPDPTTSAILLGKFADNSRVHVVQAALADRLGTARLNINASRPTNSLLPRSESLEPALKALSELVEQVDVQTTTIDDYCKVASVPRVDVLKLDLQGYDFLALQGATATLQQVRVVLVEVMFKEFYQGCHLFPDVLGLMIASGFELHTLCGLHYGLDEELLWSDAIFVKQGSRAERTARPL